MSGTGGSGSIILGGTGFIGAEIVRQLVNAGKIPTMMVHKRPPADGIIGNIHIFKSSLGGLNWDQFERGSFSTAYHLARMNGRGKYGRLFAAYRGKRANQKLIHKLEKMESSPLLAYVAGTMAYGSCGDRAVIETDPLNPTGYAREYCIAEEPVFEAIVNRSIPGIILRAPWVVGNGSWMKRFYLEPLRQKGIVPIYCTGTNWMSFIHLSDCARMIIHFAEAGKSGIVCNIVSGVNVRQNEFAELLGNITGAPVRRISAYAVTSRYGRAAAEAFEFSLRASTVHEDMVKNFKLLYPGLKLMLEDILSTCR